MFRRLGDFGFQRSAVQAIGFYLVYFFAGIIVSGVLGGVFGMATGAKGIDESMQVGLTVGMYFAIFFTAVLSFAILRAKGQLKNMLYLFVGLLSVAVGWLGGLLFGLMLVAFLTTRPINPEIDAMAHPMEGVAAH